MIVVSGENLLDVFKVKNNNYNFVNGGAGYNTCLLYTSDAADDMHV